MSASNLSTLLKDTLLTQPTHIDHSLSSLSEALPTELADDYDPPRKTVEGDHATQGYANLQLVQDAAITAKKKVSAAGRKLGLQQHWIDFAGRKTSQKGKKGIVGSVEMADADSATSRANRSLMAGYADSAANRQAAELRREIGGRIDVLETGLNTFSTQLATVDSKMERQHSEILQADKSKGNKGGYGKGGGQGNKGKWRNQQQQPLQPRFQQQQQQQQQQQWQQQPQ